MPGAYISGSEGAGFSGCTYSPTCTAGVWDIPIACADNLKGFAEVIASVYHKAEVQSCIVHPIHNSLNYVAGKDQKEFMRDLSGSTGPTPKTRPGGNGAGDIS